jgi:preprotein translocase subunit SecY
MIEKLSSVLSRVLFVGCLAAAALAFLEKLLNAFGFTILGGGYAPSRLLEFAAVGVLFVIAVQLRELKEIEKSARGRGPT